MANHIKDGIDTVKWMTQVAKKSNDATCTLSLLLGKIVITCEINGGVPFFWVQDDRTNEGADVKHYEPTMSELVDLIDTVTIHRG